MLKYINYDHINIEEELLNIKREKEAIIRLEPNNKTCLFLLGMLFANGIKIQIENEKELDLSGEGKNFSVMSYVWSKIGDNSFPKPDYSDVKTEIDQRIENVKRMGVSVEPAKNDPIPHKIFLICPVRNATEEQRKWIEDFVQEKEEKGYQIHAPHLHTKQTDMFRGYAICCQNRDAVASSEEVDIYYDQNSTGSVFDLGVAYALKKPIRLLNEQEIQFREDDIIDQMIKDWPYSKDKSALINKIRELLEPSWTKETCSPGLREGWDESNPSLGQCAITALIVNDFFGGKIMRCMSPTGSHYYNLIGDTLVDLTLEQFIGDYPDYEKGAERSRDYLLSNEDTKKRYEQLLQNLKETMRKKEKGNQK